LECGHCCQARCHSDAMHAVWPCEMPCQRQHSPCEHLCQKSTCGEDCGLCTIPIDDVQLPCGHMKDRVPCHLTQDRDSIYCDVLVSKEVPGCNHTVEIKCSLDINDEKFRCPLPCTEHLSCGHQCPGSCGRCNQKNATGQSTVKHCECTKICGRKYGTCNHNCKRKCHGGSDCGLCQQPCEVSFTSAVIQSMRTVINTTRYVASTHFASRSVMNPAHHALNSVLGPANTEATVRCHARLLAIDCHAMHDAQNCFHVDTSAQDFVAKNVRSISVSSVGRD
jgi:hypothetical protein